MKITDLLIDSRSLGKTLWLVEVAPAYEYKDGRRTDSITGYRYVIVMPEKQMDKLSVRIDGEQLMDCPESYAEVHFENLEVFVYWSRGDYAVGAKQQAFLWSIQRLNGKRRWEASRGKDSFP